MDMEEDFKNYRDKSEAEISHLNRINEELEEENARLKATHKTEL